MNHRNDNKMRTIVAVASAAVAFSALANSRHSASIAAVSPAPVAGLHSYGATPDIWVQGNGIDIADGDTTPSLANGTDFGPVPIYSSVEHEFRVGNDGTLVLHFFIPTNPKILGPHAGDFSVSDSVTLPISPNSPPEGKRFAIVFAPTGTGLRSATVRFDSDDPDEDPYTFDIQGWGAGPDIWVKGNGGDIANGDMTPSLADGTDFDQVPIGSSVENDFRVGNDGTLVLHFFIPTNPKILGPHAGDFSVSDSVTLPISPNSPVGGKRFAIVFTPSGTGLRSATVRFDSDDPDEDPYTFAVQGWGGCAALNYCLASGNSTGTSARMGWQGTLSMTNNDFVLTETGAPPLKFGLFFYGAVQTQTFLGEGMLCIATPVQRIQPIVLTDQQGSASLPIDFASQPFASGTFAVSPFSTWNFQFWYRDPLGGPSGFNFSDGLEATFCP